MNVTPPTLPADLSEPQVSPARLKNPFSLEGRVALVTGSSQGIGFALARGLARAGAAVVLNGRDTGKLETAAKTLKDEGVNATTIAFDVTDSAAVTAGVACIQEQLGPIGILINNAGIARRRAFADMTEEDWQAVLDANLSSAFRVTKAAAPMMRGQRFGRIINVCSLMSSIARRDNTNYAAAKGGLAMFTKALAVELGGDNITVNGIAPGYFDTPLARPLKENPAFNEWLINRTPMRRWGNPDELAGTAVYLASDAAAFVTGQILYVDGGITASL